MNERMIVIQGDGKTEFVGVWKVGEILNAAQGLINFVNNVEVNVNPPAPQPKTETPQA